MLTTYEAYVTFFSLVSHLSKLQYSSFYSQFNLSMVSYVLSTTENIKIDYISSPEVNFLTSIFGKVGWKTKLVFRFLDETLIEPFTNQTYGALLKNLTFVRTFASGILVPKNYIWPVTDDNYLLPYTSVVDDAHKVGLEIYTGDFANDDTISYNYSSDPLAEYLSFTDNGAFTVDGVLSLFPNTASEAIGEPTSHLLLLDGVLLIYFVVPAGCFSNLNKKRDHGMPFFFLSLPNKLNLFNKFAEFHVHNAGKPLIIAYNGASADYPGCTDLSYTKAVFDGADVIDCPIQMTRDGIPICMSSIDLMDDTNVADSRFAQPVVIKDLKGTRGVFSFNLSWNDIVKNLMRK